MHCPNCGHIQPDGAEECQRCQIVFAKWRPRETRSPAHPNLPLPSDAPVPDQAARPAASALWAHLAGIAALGLVLAWLLIPTGHSVPEEAYRSDKHRFAVSPPADWLMLTRENYDSIMDEYGDRFPAALRTTMRQNKNLSVGFFRLGEDETFSPSFNVVVMEGNLPPINDAAKEEASRELSKMFSSMFEDYVQDAVEIIKVDGLRSLEILSRATLSMKTAEPQYYESENEWGYVTRERIADAEYTDYRLRYRQVLVPGKKRAYILTFTALERQFESLESTFQGILDSFRVLQRPPRFNPIIQGGLIGGLVGGLIALGGGLLKRLGGPAA